MFDIPETVKIGGTEYEVNIVPLIRDTLNPVGRLSADASLIEIVEAESESFMKQTFLHELIHGLHYQMGYNGDPDIENERYVDAMANALYALLVDNPEIFTTKEK